MKTEQEIKLRVTALCKGDPNHNRLAMVNALRWALEPSEEATEIERLKAKIDELETDIELAKM